MESVDKGMGVPDGSWREKRKRGRPRKYGLNAPIIHSVSPLPIADSSPAGFPTNFLVFPVKNRTLVPTGSFSAAGASQSKALLHGAVSQNLGAEHKLPVHSPEPYKSNMETAVITGRQAQMQIHQLTSTVAELSTSFESARKKIKELGKQVPGLVQIEKWNNQIASWDEKKKELEKERDEAREAALKAVDEKHDLEKKLEKAIKEAEASAKRAIGEKHDLTAKLEKAAKQAESVKALTKKAINEAALKFVDERRDLEDKLEMAVKQVEDAQASGKKAIYEAVASTTNCYKICLDNFVASLGSGELKSLEDHVTKLVKALPHDDGTPAEVAVEHEGDGDKNDDGAMQLRMSQRSTKPNPKYVRRE